MKGAAACARMLMPRSRTFRAMGSESGWAMRYRAGPQPAVWRVEGVRAGDSSSARVCVLHAHVHVVGLGGM